MRVVEDIDVTYYVLPGTDRNFPVTLLLVIILAVNLCVQLDVFDEEI